MHRQKLLELLKKYNPSDKNEIYNKQQALNFINEYSDCFKRELEVGHFTGSCWLESYDRTKFLLTKHKIFKDWLQLGGHADGNPDILNVALKEAHEESGLKNIEIVFPEIFDIGYHLAPKHRAVPQHYHYDIRFLLRAINSNEKIQISDESDDLKWFELPTTDNTDINRMFRKWKNLGIAS